MRSAVYVISIAGLLLTGLWAGLIAAGNAAPVSQIAQIAPVTPVGQAAPAATDARPIPNEKEVTDMAQGNMEYQARDFSRLKGMKGFSDMLLSNHFTLYQGYVNNTNLYMRKFREMNADAKDPSWAELKRRFAFEFDGMRLHEFYFDNLGGNGQLQPNSDLYKELDEQFGGFDNWKKDFAATGSVRGIGWAVLYLDMGSGESHKSRLINCWINEHHVGHLPGCQPILVMDVWEHAYMNDYQLDRASYISSFMQNINWDMAQRRYSESAKMVAQGAGRTYEPF